MKKWAKNCYSFERVRELCRQPEESVDICKKIMAALVTSCNELIPDPELWPFGESFEELRDAILEEMELMCSEDEYEECEDTVNHYLDEMYELCDVAGVWLVI